MAGIVYEGVRSMAGDGGKLFDGQSFWFSSAVPQRKWLIENAVANGAIEVPLEKQADVLIVDHARKNAPVGTHSYKYIELSIRNGTLENLADHVVGPSKRTDRPVGSMITAPKGSRSKFTETEDQLLWNFMKPYELAGGATGGNEIYKQMEEVHGNGNHTYQSWRDRWLKHVRFQKRQITDTTGTLENEVEQTEATQQVARGSSSRPLPLAASPLISNSRKGVDVVTEKAPLDSPGRSRGTHSSSEDATTRRYLQKLEQKLGRRLPSGPTSSHFRDWEQVPDPNKPEDVARRDAFQLQRQRAGSGTQVPTEEGVLEDQSMQPSQIDVEESDEDAVPVGVSQGDDEYFTHEDYDLLMKAAEHLIHVGDLEDEGWEKVAYNYPRHTSESWREFWEGKVKPDFLKNVMQVKQEQGEGVESGTPQKVAEQSPEQRDEVPSTDEAADDEIEDVVEGSGHGKVAEEPTRLDDGLNSLFSTPIAAPSREPSPFTCRWFGCDVDVPDIHVLFEHVSSKHRPGTSEITGDCGYTCRWRGCSTAGMDQHGKAILLDFPEYKLWVNHFIKEHINAIRLKYGLGQSESQGRVVEHDTLTTRSQILQIKSKGSDSDAPLFALTSLQMPRQRQKLWQVDGSSEEDEDEEGAFNDENKGAEEAADDESEEAEGTDPTSSSEESGSEESGNQIINLSSVKGEDERNPDISPRRSTRPRDPPTPQYTKVPMFSYVDTAVGSSPPLLAEETPAKEIPAEGMNSSPARALSASPPKPPEPNEARKRTATKGNSQESNQSTTLVQEVIELQGEEPTQQSVRLSPRKRTREPEMPSESTRQKSPELPSGTNFEPESKRMKQRHDQEEPLEIPSTPDHRIILGELYQEDDEHQGSSMLGGSPTPRPRVRFESGNESILRTTPRRANFQAEDLEHTSPLQISMFSDPDNKFALSSPAKSLSTRQDELSSESDLDLHTAPQNTSNLWVTAPSEEADEDDAGQESHYETAPESKGKEREIPETQDLFVRSIPDVEDEEADPFTLPEPEGGWPDGMDDDDDLRGPLTELAIPTSQQPERFGDEIDEDDDDADDDDAASIPSDVCGWVDERVAEDDSINDEILLCAIQATSGFNERLIHEVHDFIRARKRRKDPDILPRHMKGCWTQEDDEALQNNDARDRMRIVKKHGQSSVERRSAWLNMNI